MMTRTITKGESKAYREFSRVMYQKYQLKHPRMKPQEIVAKVVKEWTQLGAIEKNELINKYLKELNVDEKVEEDSAPLDTAKKHHPPTPKTDEKEVFQEIRVEEEEVREEKTDKVEEKAMHTPLMERHGEVKLERKTKTITKPRFEVSTKQEEYRKFFKYYYDRLTTEHPRWSSNQVAAIIKLLWRKRNMKTKAIRKEKTRQEKPHKRMSGRETFKREMLKAGVEPMSIRKSWAHLPKEAKRLWEKRGSEGAEKSNEPQKEKVNVLRLKNTITLSTQSLADEYETNKADLFAFLNYKRSQ